MPITESFDRHADLYDREKFGLRVAVGTHPIPQKYWLIHQKMKTWQGPHWESLLRATMSCPEMRAAYD